MRAVFGLLLSAVVLALSGALGATAAGASGGTTVTFSYTGAVQTWTVPSGVTSIQVTAEGAQGAGTYGGLGGEVQATIPVSPGSTVNVYVGGAGSGSIAGFNGGGGGSQGAFAGGGASDVRIGGTALANRVVVAGGGGGEAGNGGVIFGTGGSGGGLKGEAGGNGSGQWVGGGGGTQTAGGSSGDLSGSGSLGQGGAGTIGGGGGGGYYGGGGGEGDSYGGSGGGGGGGSSFTEPSAADVSSVQGFSPGNGQVSITYPPSSGMGNPTPGSQTFSYTGSPQAWTVPDGVTSISVQAFGGQGGGAYGGFGAEAQGIVPVTPGQTIEVMVGGGGSGSTAGFNGGGSASQGGYGGGGASDVRVGGIGLVDRVLVAAGGGGAGSGANSIYGMAGSGGGLSGETGGNGNGQWVGGGGGSQTAGGSSGDLSKAGVLGQGGAGTVGGGGGGGYYGGGGGEGDSYGGSAAGGGGGSSYAAPSATGVAFVKGASTGNGQVTITWPPAPPSPPNADSGTFAFSYTGAYQLWTVPAGSNQIGVAAAGAQGAPGSAAAGLGGSEQGVVPVTPGQIVAVVVGGQGSTTAGGFNGGGGLGVYSDSGGGGASDVRIGGWTLADRMVVAGGGGGGSSNASGGYGKGGDGGGLVGQAGGNGSGQWLGGGGGSQTAGGSSGDLSKAGVLGQGGQGTIGGGGGGGYYGGGGGEGDSYGGSGGGGGGGSSFAAPQVNQAATQSGTQLGDGAVILYTGSAIPGNTLLAALELLGGGNPSEPGVGGCHGCSGLPVDTQSGNFFHSFADLQISGRGQPLALTRTYNSALASVSGPFGYGWSWSYGISLSVASGQATVSQENGSQVVFSQTSGGQWVAAPRVQASLVHNGDGSWTLTRGNGVSFTFDSSGRLTAETDRNGYKTSLAYNGSGQLTTATDPAGRTLSFSYWPSGLVETVTDSSGRSVSYGYDTSQNLTSVTDVLGGVTSFGYDGSHRLLTMLDPDQAGSSNPQPLTNVYDNSGRVTKQTDPLGRVTSFDYTSVPGSTLITNPDGSQTLDTYSDGELTQQTVGYGAPQAATTKYSYDSGTDLRTSTTDPDGRVSVYRYDAHGNLNYTADPDGNTSSATYNALGQPLRTIDPAGIETNYSYDSTGNLLTKTVTGIGGSPTATTQYTYADSSHPGDLTSVTDPAGYVTDYGYDANGDLTSVTTHPNSGVSDTTAYVYDSLGRPVCEASANATAAGVVCPAAGQPRVADTTTWDYYANGQVNSVTDPAGNTTSYVDDPDGNQTKVTDPAGNVTKNVYNLDGELTSSTVGYGTSSAATTSYGYLLSPGSGACSASVNAALVCDTVTDPNGNVTVDYFDAAGNKIQEGQPTSGTTTYAYDSAGQLKSETTAAGQTSFDYDAAGRLTSITYGTPANGYSAAANVNYSYDADGNRLTMSDGTGTSQYSYDSLERLGSVADAAGNKVSYSYTADNAVKAITYPNAQTVNYGYDNAGEVTSVGDWLGNTTSIGYDHDANATSEALPNDDTSTVSYNNDDQISSISDAPTATPQSPFASFSYGRNANSGLQSETDTGVPAPTSQSYGYDSLNRLTSSTSGAYSYDPAGDPIQLANGNVQTFSPADRLTAAAGPISLVGTGSAANTRASSLTVTLPTGVQANDQILLAVTLPYGITATTPSGYTLVGDYQSGTGSSSDQLILYRRTVQPGDGSPSIAFSSKTAAVATLAVYRGVNTITPIDATSSGSTNSGTTVTAPSITPSLAGDRLLLFEGANYSNRSSGTFTQPSGMTSRISTTASGKVTGAIADQPLTTGDPTGDRAATFSLTAALVGVMVALEPNETTYSYDSRGDRTRVTTPAGTSTNLAYDQTDRLVGYGANSNYTYNGDGLRTNKTVNGTGEHFTWDTNTASGTPLLLADGSTNYIFGPDGLPLEQINGNTVLYYLHDQLGSTRLLTSGGGSVSATYTYDPYGNLAGSTGTTTTPFGYAGAYTDAESGLAYLTSRNYDPATAQFLSVDPAVNATQAPYKYTGDNAINATDPSGLGPFGVDLNPVDYYHDATRYLGSAGGELVNAGTSVASTAYHAADSALCYLGQAESSAADWLWHNKNQIGIQAGIVFVGVLTDGAAIPELEELDAVNEGVYVIRGAEGTYVGQSGNIAQRFAQHLVTNGGRFTQDELDVAERFAVSGGKTAREIAEQQKIDELDGIGNLLNQRNPIGPRRFYLMPEGYSRP